MGEEDKYALRSSPENLGAATFWNQRIWNMTKKTVYAEIEALNNISSAWNNNEVPEETMLKIKDIVSGDINSRNKEDQVEQNNLWMELMALTMSGMDPLHNFDEWIMSNVWTTDKSHYPTRFATLHPILHFLQDANKLDPANGLWKPWKR